MRSKNPTLILIGCMLCCLLLTASAKANPFEYNWQQLAPDVWAAIRQDPFELPQEGNAVFVVTDQGVVLFDAGGSPLMGAEIVAKVRSVTNKPITHVVISHWHGDHMRGLQSIQQAFPQVQIFAHPYSRDFIISTQDRWLKRRVSMVPNIRKGLTAAFNNNLDLSGRLLIKLDEQTVELPAGQLLVLEKSLSHDVTALEDSALLLSISWPHGVDQEPLGSL